MTEGGGGGGGKVNCNTRKLEVKKVPEKPRILPTWDQPLLLCKELYGEHNLFLYFEATELIICTALYVVMHLLS